MSEPVLHPTTIFTCNDDFSSMMSCIYDAWASQLGHSNIRLMTEPIGNLQLFCTYRHVTADDHKTQSVIRSIQKKISIHVYRMVYQAAMADHSDKLDIIYRFLILGFYYGASITNFLQNPLIRHFIRLTKKVGTEAHHYKEFIRFSDTRHKILISVIEPKSNVLTLIAPYFSDRMPSEDFMILDMHRNTAIVHPSNSDYYLTCLSEEEKNQISMDHSNFFSDLWKTFFSSVSIKERKNPNCQRNMLPIWYRKHMSEFI